MCGHILVVDATSCQVKYKVSGWSFAKKAETESLIIHHWVFRKVHLEYTEFSSTPADQQNYSVMFPLVSFNYHAISSQDWNEHEFSTLLAPPVETDTHCALLCLPMLNTVRPLLLAYVLLSQVMVLQLAYFFILSLLVWEIENVSVR